VRLVVMFAIAQTPHAQAIVIPSKVAAAVSPSS